MTDYTKLVEALRGKFIAYDVTGNHNSAQLYKDAADAIEALQAELPKRGEIVRCKDCKWWEAVRGNTIGLCSHEDWTSHNLCNAVDKDGFCYRGESKDDWFCADGERSET